MENIDKIKKFVNSAYDSPEDEKFGAEVLKPFFEDRKKKHYESLLQKQFGSELKSASKEENNKNTRKFPWRQITVLIGAVAAIFSGIMFLTSSDALHETYSNQDFYEKINIATRGAVSDAEALKTNMLEFYDKKAFSDAVNAYESIESQRFSNKEKFVIALSYANIGQIENSHNLYRSILNSPETRSSYHQETRWYAGLTAVKSKDFELAKTFFREIKSGDYKFDDAQKLMDSF